MPTKNAFINFIKKGKQVMSTVTDTKYLCQNKGKSYGKPDKGILVYNKCCFKFVISNLLKKPNQTQFIEERPCHNFVSAQMYVLRF